MKTAQAKIQKFGSLLSAMVMPNIGVFIGWGLLTALFIDTGWTPNAYLNKLVSPILTYLLPCLIGYTAGSNIYGRRGGVIGAFATMGAVVGADVTMLVAGMILGPVAAICIRAFDKAVEGKVKPGLEMLVDNFSLGIIGFVICIIGYVGVAPIMTAIQTVLTGGVQYLTDHNMLPLTIIGPILGNMFSLFVLTNFGGGVVGPVSPGSVISYYMMTPKACMLVNTIAYFGSLAISFAGAAIVLKAFKHDEEEEGIKELAATADAKIQKLNKVIFACDAGMGSSAMGVTILKKKLEEIGLKPEIKHVAVADIPKDADVVVTNVNLEERAKMSLEGTNIPILTLSNFMDQTEYERIIVEIQRMLGHDVPDVFCKDNIVLNAKYANKEEAIKACADIFIKGGYTDESYKADMLQRDKEASVYLGNGVALPHGLASSKETIKNSGICFVQVPDGVDFNGEKAYLLVGVAGKGEEHVELLGKIGQSLMDEGVIEKLKNSTSKEEVINLLNL